MCWYWLNNWVKIAWIKIHIYSSDTNLFSAVISAAVIQHLLKSKSDKRVKKMMKRYLIMQLIAFGLFLTVVDCIACRIVMVSTSTQLSPSSTSTRKFDFASYSRPKRNIWLTYPWFLHHTWLTFKSQENSESLSWKSLKSPDLTTSRAVSQTSEPYIPCLGRLVTELPLNGSDVTIITATEYRMEFRIIYHLLYLKDRTRILSKD